MMELLVPMLQHQTRKRDTRMVILKYAVSVSILVNLFAVMIAHQPSMLNALDMKR